jgi:alginate O-acetyltransferase complex protein AlgI
VIGLGKKVLIANTLAVQADLIFAIPADQLSAPVAWLGIACYTLQIYFDFSGYSDMAIGLGYMFGFRFLENFSYPYVAQSVTEFWRRWHISLSTWFRDYLYIPLGGNRGSAFATYRNLVVVFFLCGLWHGASWTFVVWGLLHGFALVIERVGLGKVLQACPSILRHAYLLFVVTTGWVFFRADSLHHAVDYLGAMFGMSRTSGTEHPLSLYLDAPTMLALVAGAIGSAPVIVRLRAFLEARPGTSLATWAGVGEIAGLGLVLLACSMLLAAGTYNPFIYFRF